MSLQIFLFLLFLHFLIAATLGDTLCLQALPYQSIFPLRTGRLDTIQVPSHPLLQNEMRKADCIINLRAFC